MTSDADRTWSDDMPDAYERLLVPTVFQPFALELAARVTILDPSTILELAAGTGIATREVLAALPGVDITATDLNPSMVALGEARTPKARWQVADAGDLPFEDATFDLVLAAFGAMFFPDKVATFAEAGRVLSPTGRLLFTTWASLEQHGFELVLIAALEKLFPRDPPRFIATVPHGYADPDEVVADLGAAGLVPAPPVLLVVEGHSPSAATLAEGYCTGTPLRAELEARGASPSEVIGPLAAELEAELGSGPITASMAAWLFEAAHR